MDIYNSYMEVDLNEIGRNIDKIRNGIGPGVDIIAVLKANAYGLGLNAIGTFLTESCGINILACAQAFEAVSLREANIKKDIFILGGVPYHNIPAVVAYDIQTVAYNSVYLSLLDEEAGRQNKKAAVQIKIETGFNRLGVLPGEETEHLCQHLKTLKNVKVVGIYTHFIQSELEDKGLCYQQYALFKEALTQVKAHNFELKYIHVCNSAATTWFSAPEMTHVRPAGLLFGFDYNIEPVNKFALNEVVSWKTFVTNVKTVSAGANVGYNGRFIASKPTTVAIASIGYGDGYNRTLAMSGKAEMIINGRRVLVIGICMDQVFLDVTGIPVKINDTVTIAGKDGGEFISLFELKRKMGQTFLSILTVIPERVKRIYLQ